MIKKHKPLKNEAFKQFIRECACYACCYKRANRTMTFGLIKDQLCSVERMTTIVEYVSIKMQCEGINKSDPHHIKPGKDDRYMIPLCRDHHNEVGRGKKTFAKKYGITDYKELADLYWERYSANSTRK